MVRSILAIAFWCDGIKIKNVYGFEIYLTLFIRNQHFVRKRTSRPRFRNFTMYFFYYYYSLFTWFWTGGRRIFRNEMHTPGPSHILMVFFLIFFFLWTRTISRKFMAPYNLRSGVVFIFINSLHLIPSPF